MSIMDDVVALATLGDVLAHAGYAATGAKPPYYVVRPLYIGDGAEGPALNGERLVWDTQLAVYCCGASVAASLYLAEDLMKRLQGASLAGSTIETSMGYIGAQVDGHYESEVTIQLNRGSL